MDVRGLSNQMADLVILGQPALYLVLAIIIVTIATFVQTSSGLGFAMIAMPALAAIDLQYVPGPALFLMLFLSITMAYVGRKSVSKAGVSPLLCGMVIGVPIGAAALYLVDPNRAGLLFSIVILAALASPRLGLSFARSTKSYALFGMASGLIGTISGMHGPVLAVLFQGTPNYIARPTIAAIFVIGASLSLVSLWWIGRFGTHELQMSAALAPGLVIGFVLANSPLNRMSDKTVSMMMTSLAALSAVVIIIRELSAL